MAHVTLETAIHKLGVRLNKNQIAALHKRGIFSAADLLFFVPKRYIDFSQHLRINQVQPNTAVTLSGVLSGVKAIRALTPQMKPRTEAYLVDHTGKIKIFWFGQPYLASRLPAGESVLVSGTPRIVGKYLSLANPNLELLEDEQHLRTGRIMPVYPALAGISQYTWHKLVAACLPATELLPETLPTAVTAVNQLPENKTVPLFLHTPRTLPETQAAQNRIAFEKLFVEQLALGRYMRLLAALPRFEIPSLPETLQVFTSNLPFALRASQKRALWDAVQDMSQPDGMNRIIIGDVGSGKTVVALGLVAHTTSQTKQVALVCPTEILARQHFQTAAHMLQRFGLNIALATSSGWVLNNREIDTAHALEKLADGTINFVIGTHALFQGAVTFQDLALVIIDEQHKFGVEQRGFLMKQKIRPHLLTLSATPIPRTYALAWYNQVAVSTLTAQQKREVSTRILDIEQIDTAWSLIEKELAQKNQVYVTTARLSTEHETRPWNAINTANALAKRFPKAAIALLHGKLKKAEQEQIMTAFTAGEIEILVATSIIEVGVDVPNATAMVILHAEQFGLAQLHQLRGRVGRGSKPGICILLSDDPNIETQQRLRNFTKMNDGFKLAALDVQQRGFGSLLGTEQSGINTDLFISFEILQAAHTSSHVLLDQDPELKKYPELRARIEPIMKNLHLE